MSESSQPSPRPSRTPTSPPGWTAALARRRRHAPSTSVEFRGANLALQDSTADEIVLGGPAGTGKTRAALEKIWRLAHNYPGSRFLIVRKTRASLSESALVTLERDVMGLSHPLVENGPQRSHRRSYRLPNGSEIATGGMDKASRILSTEYDVIYVPEATELNLEDWETLSTRLRNGVLPYQQLVGDCNPGPPTHWIKRRAEERALELLPTTHRDNPALYDDDGERTPDGDRYLGRLDRLTGVRRARFLDGLWVAAEGVVYSEWDATRNELPNADALPPLRRRYLSIDFGFTNPFVCQWWGEDADGRLYLYREIYRTERLVEDHAREIRDLSGSERFARVICDHDAEDRATLERHLRLKTTAARKAILEGIEAVKARMRPAGDGHPRLLIVRDALASLDRDLLEAGLPTSTRDELGSYVYAPSVSGRPNREEPVDEYNHGMDALRYMVAHRDGLGRGRSTSARAARSLRR